MSMILYRAGPLNFGNVTFWSKNPKDEMQWSPLGHLWRLEIDENEWPGRVVAIEDFLPPNTPRERRLGLMPEAISKAEKAGAKVIICADRIAVVGVTVADCSVVRPDQKSAA